VFRSAPRTTHGAESAAHARARATAQAAGDVYFGLSQLLLPYMCTGRDEHMSLWCNNRKWLSGGAG
jgi:hypothetical protein